MIKIHFINWWSNGVNDFFHFFVRKYIDSDVIFDPINPDIVFCSVFGKRTDILKYLKSKKCISIFFTGECTNQKTHREYDDYLLNVVDISLGFKENQGEQKSVNKAEYIRFPLWITYINLEPYGCGKKELSFENLLEFSYLQRKDRFCCILNNHDKFGTRTDIFDRLNKYKKIDSGGKWKNNIDYKIPDGEDKKLEWLSHYKFNICCESMLDSGYITEKLFESLIAGCIPIYLVRNHEQSIESSILNQDIILKFTHQDIDKTVEKIIEIDKNATEYQRFISQGILKPNAKNLIFEKYEILAKKIQERMNIDEKDEFQ